MYPRSVLSDAPRSALPFPTCSNMPLEMVFSMEFLLTERIWACESLCVVELHSVLALLMSLEIFVKVECCFASGFRTDVATYVCSIDVLASQCQSLEWGMENV